MNLVATLEALVEAGGTPEMMLAIVRRYEVEREIAASDRRAKDADRQRASRERHAESRGQAVTLRDSTDPLPETKVSPAPPSKTQPSPEPPKPPLRGSKGSKRCPVDWMPKPGTIATLDAEGHSPGDLERALTRMRDHEFKSARSDWDATFRNWVRYSADRAPRQAHERPHSDAKLDAKNANYARAWTGSERAARFRGEP